MGHLRFIIFYLLCGLAGAAAQILPDPGSLDPVVGASGAISGVLAAAIMLHPTARLRLPLGRRRIVLPVSLYAVGGGVVWHPACRSAVRRSGSDRGVAVASGWFRSRNNPGVAAGAACGSGPADIPVLT